MESDRSPTAKPGETTTKPGPTTGAKPADTTKPSATTGTKPTDTTTKSGAATQSGDKPGADTAKVDLKPEQTTQLKQRITTVNIRTVPETQLNVPNISVGVVIPRTVELVVIPNEIVQIVPQFRGYRIIRTGSRYLIVHPETYRIVYIISI